MLTAKQEAFCLAIASGLNYSDAYRKAYDASTMKPATINRKAKALTDNGKISTRISAMRKPVVEKMQYGLEQAMGEAEQAFVVARNREQGGAMVAAVQLRSKLNGLLVERSEVRTGPLDNLPPDEAKALMDAIDAIQHARAKGADKRATDRPAVTRSA